MKEVAGYTRCARFCSLEGLQEDSADLSLIYCGWENCDPGYRYGPNMRTSYVLHIVRNGKGTLEINGKKYELRKGDAFLLSPETEAWYEADQEEPWSYAWVGFIGYRAQEYVQQAGFTEEHPIRCVGCIEELSKYIDGMLLAHQLRFSDEMKRNGYLMVFFATLIREYEKMVPEIEEQQTRSGGAYVKLAMEYIEYHYREKIKINEIADYIGVNRSYLTNSFKKAVGCSPQEYLVNLRMEKAKAMLRNTSMQIYAVASAVGYNDQLAFSKIFKQHYGVSPRVYRETEKELLKKTEEKKNV